MRHDREHDHRCGLHRFRIRRRPRSDADTNVAATSSGDSIVDTAGARATSCDDREDDPCRGEGGQDADRDPEIAYNWERERGDHGSAESINLSDGSGEYEVLFEDVTIGPGRKVAYMLLATLARDIESANRRARSTNAPSFVFADLSDDQRRRIRNW